MKKFLLILAAAFVSLMGYGLNPNTDWNNPNPFAYNLRANLNATGDTIFFHYTLNAPAIHGEAGSEDLKDGNKGLQIYLLDEDSTRITTYYREDGTVREGIYNGTFNKGENSGYVPISEIPHEYQGKELGWEVVVNGNQKRTIPKAVTNYKTIGSGDYYKPRAAHGIAIDNNPTSENFGKIFMTEAHYQKNGTEEWIPSSIYEYDMQLQYQGYHTKNQLWDFGSSTYEGSYFSQTPNYEPHRVKISEDGRVFVTCYHTSAADAVLEYMGNNQFKTIISCGESWYKYGNANTSRYYRRAIDMDLRGSGDDLTMIVAWLIPKDRQDNNGNWMAKIEVREYQIGNNNYNVNPDNGNENIVAEFLDWSTNPGVLPGLLFQGVRGGTTEPTTTYTNTAGEKITIPEHWNSINHGMVGIAYDPINPDYIWMKVDFTAGIFDGGEGFILCYDKKSEIKNTSIVTFRPPHDADYHPGIFGGNAMFIKGNTITTGGGGTGGSLLQFTFKRNADGKTFTHEIKQYESLDIISNIGTGNAINAFAEDYAGNLYALSESADDIIVIAMPYSGSTTTRANETICLPTFISQEMSESEMKTAINYHNEKSINNVAIYRPMPNTSFSTICLPFDVNREALAEDHPYKTGTLLSFTGVNLKDAGGEKILELQFNKADSWTKHQPYLFKPIADISNIITLGTPDELEDIESITNGKYQNTKYFNDGQKENSITFWSIIHTAEGLSLSENEVCLILVADNRLAQVSSLDGMLGLRALFSLPQPLPQGIVPRITTNKNSPTNIIYIDGQRVNVEKYLQEGSVYIRVGEHVYNMNGEMIK